MNTVIKPSVAHGTVAAPPSKSMAHRLLIAAGLSVGKSTVSNIDFSEDILATIDCLRALGATVDVDEPSGVINILGINPRTATIADGTTLCCRESGSTMRFMIPLALLSAQKIHLIGKGRLPERPMTIYKELCEERSLLFDQSCDGICVCGPLTPSTYHVPGDISSQFVTGLLFALPLLEGDSDIRLTTPLESKPYIDLTLSALSAAGIAVEQLEDGYHIRGNQHYSPIELAVEGDYSNAAFIEALNLIGGKVNITGLSETSYQGDKIYRTYFREMASGMPTLDIRDCPDLAPILMTMGAALHGVRLQGTRRLKIKESDRGLVMAQELRKFGAEITLFDDEIIVHQSKLRKPDVTLEGYNDHRIVMSLAILATKYGGEIIGSEAVSKSYPHFFDMLTLVGIDVEHSI